MGIVYLADQQPIRRRVALKVLHPHLAADPAVKARFVNEAAAVCRLNHPSTITVYDFGEAGSGTLYIAMEYVEGRDLRQLVLEERRLPWRRAARVAAQIARSLGDAHAHGVVHRDLKPANVMVFDRGTERDLVKVLDFGVAKILEPEAGAETLTRSGMLLGTPQFLSPESIRGESVDHRADIYALGLILYEMLAARPPFDGKTLARLLTQHLLEEPPPPETVCPSLDAPAEFCALVLRMLAKDPAARPASMTDVARALDSMEEPVVVPPAPVARIVAPAHAEPVAPAVVPAAAEAPPQPGIPREDSPGVIAPAPAAAPTAPADRARPAVPAARAPARATLAPVAAPAPPPRATAAPVTQGVVERLFARMRANPDFPAVARVIGELNVIASSETSSAAQLASVILKDVALASKVLRLVNSSYHGPAAGQITTVSHAIVLLGFDAVRDAALNVLLMSRARGNPELAEIALGSLLRAAVARNLGARLSGPAAAERAYSCGLFCDLGRYLAAHYFPDEWGEAKHVAAAEQLTVETAVERVLGASLEMLGAAVARSWGFPDVVVESMEPLPSGRLARPRTTADQIRQAAGFASELVTLLSSAAPEDRERKLGSLVKRFGDNLPIDAKSVAPMVEQAVAAVDTMARASFVDVRGSAHVAAARAFAGHGSATPAAGAHPGPAPGGPPTPANGTADRTRILLRRLHEISAVLTRDFEIDDVVTMVVETAFTGFEFENVFYASIDPDARTATVTHALGARLAQAVGNERFFLDDVADASFGPAVAEVRDLVIADTREPNVAAGLPAWYEQYRASALALFPVVLDGVPHGIFYVDGPAVLEGTGTGASDHRLGYMSRLRNTVVLAIRKRGEADSRSAQTRASVAGGARG